MYISTYLQSLFDKTPTLTSLRMADKDPPEEVVPHPVTVAVTSANVCSAHRDYLRTLLYAVHIGNTGEHYCTSDKSVGRQTGLMCGWAAKSTAFFSLSME